MWRQRPAPQGTQCTRLSAKMLDTRWQTCLQVHARLVHPPGLPVGQRRLAQHQVRPRRGRLPQRAQDLQAGGGAGLLLLLLLL